MRWLTAKARLVCKHELGVVGLAPAQSLVTIEGVPVLVDHDPEGRPIAGCPNYGPTIKPCTAPLAVQEGYSDFLRIDGRRISLDTVTGLTDGTPPGTVKYIVRDAGQTFVEQTR